MIFIGIDPGLGGAVAVIHEYTKEHPHNGSDIYYEDIKVFDTPVAMIDTKRKHLASAMALLLKPFADRNDVIAVLEHTHSMPKQGVASSFSFGEGKGLWEGILAAYNIPTELVSPQRWKKEMMADQGRDKDAARLKAMAIYPQMTEQLKRKKDDGRAESLLMAAYAQRLKRR